MTNMNLLMWKELIQYAIVNHNGQSACYENTDDLAFKINKDINFCFI